MIVGSSGYSHCAISSDRWNACNIDGGCISTSVRGVVSVSTGVSVCIASRSKDYSLSPIRSVIRHSQCVYLTRARDRGRDENCGVDRPKGIWSSDYRAGGDRCAGQVEIHRVVWEGLMLRTAYANIVASCNRYYYDKEHCSHSNDLNSHTGSSLDGKAQSQIIKSPDSTLPASSVDSIVTWLTILIRFSEGILHYRALYQTKTHF